MAKKHHINVRVTPAQYTRLKEYADKKTGGNISAAVCAAIDRFGGEELYGHADIDEPARNILARLGWRARGGGDG